MRTRNLFALIKPTTHLPIIVLLLLSFQLNAQQWVIHDNSNSGLYNNFINCLHYNSDSLWIGTENGLYSFQNNNWTHYSNQPFYDVRALTSAPDGTIWVGSFLNGLAKYANYTWTYFNTTNSGLKDDHIRALAYDTTSATLWVGTSAGLHAYQNSTWTDYTTTNSNIPGNNIPCLAIEQGTLWGGTINNGFFQLTNNQFTTYSLSNSGIGDNTQLDVVIDQQGNKWIGTPANGISVLSATGNWSIFNYSNSGISNSISSFGFTCGETYVGNSSAGLTIFGSWTHYHTFNSPLPRDEIHALANQGDTTLFIGTFGGGLVVYKPCQTTSIETIAPSIEFNLFPNPATDLLNLYFNQAPEKACQSIVYDVKGNPILTTWSSDKNQSIDLSSLDAGQYFVLVEVDGVQFARKFTIVK